jgi:hypothetical protein
LLNAAGLDAHVVGLGDQFLWNTHQDCDAGITIRQLSQKYELSDRQISNVLKKPLIVSIAAIHSRNR